MRVSSLDCCLVIIGIVIVRRLTARDPASLLLLLLLLLFDRVESRAALARWVCALHNEVNEKLGKAKWPCDVAALDERWRLGATKRCWGDGED
jgi:Erv1 / Alr family